MRQHLSGQAGNGRKAIDLRLQVAERDDHLAAAGSANRELMPQVNATTRRP
jgi:hypothetical protein